ncbi:MAG: hypothetical protein ACK559_15340, partial [bacterium]
AKDCEAKFEIKLQQKSFIGQASQVFVSDANRGLYYNTFLRPQLIMDEDIASGASISNSKLATLTTSGLVANSATSATNSNTPSTIVARDSSGNFSAGMISISGTPTH